MVLLDTHALIWVVEGSERLGRRVSRLADTALAADRLGVASISFWEMAMLVNRGRIVVNPSIDQWRLRVLGLGVQEIPLTGDIAIAAVHLAGLRGRPGGSDHRGDGSGDRCHAGHRRRSAPRVAWLAQAPRCATVGDPPVP
jgi:PIN domain nuclease of toxin-antitoxin system